MMKRFRIFLLLLVFVFAVSCAKVPEKFQSPSVKIDLSIEDNKEVYLLKFSAGIKNENNDIVIKNFKAKALVVEAEKNPGLITKFLHKLSISKNKVLLDLPVDVSVILPFEAAVIDIEQKLSDEEINPILTLLEINKEELLKNRTISGKYFEERNIELDILDYGKEDIIKLLKRKVNEKN